MVPLFFAPNPALAQYISHIMVLEMRQVGGVPQFSPFPPTPQHAIHFYPRDPVITKDKNGLARSIPASVVIGPQVSKVDIAMGLHHLIVSVAFLPGGMYRLLGIPMHELFDEPFDAALILGSGIRKVNEQLQEAEIPMDMKNIVERFLLRKLDCITLSPWERAMGVQLQNNVTIEQATALSCLSLRQFERRSKEIMGYSPKLFARLIRFSNAYRLKERHPHMNWGEIAHASGYYDQMHLIKDFKDFAGSLPGKLAREIASAPFLLQEHMRI